MNYAKGLCYTSLFIKKKQRLKLAYNKKKVKSIFSSSSFKLVTALQLHKNSLMLQIAIQAIPKHSHRYYFVPYYTPRTKDILSWGYCVNNHAAKIIHLHLPCGYVQME